MIIERKMGNDRSFLHLNTWIFHQTMALFLVVGLVAISRDLLFRTRTAWEDTWMQLELCTKEDSTVLVIPFLMSPLKDIDMLLCGMERGSWMELLPLHPPSRRSSRVVVISIIRH